MSWLLLKQNQKKVSSKKPNKTEITKTLLITAPCFMFASLQVQFAGRTPCPHASVTNWSSWVAAHSGQSKGSVVSHVGHNQSHTHTHTLWSRDKPIQTDTVWTVSNCPQMSLCETKSQEPQHCHRCISTNKQRVSRDDHCYCLLFSSIWANDSNEKICTRNVGKHWQEQKTCNDHLKIKKYKFHKSSWCSHKIKKPGHVLYNWK